VARDHPPSPDPAGSIPTTLSIDCGGTRLKAVLLDTGGTPISERTRIRTPYPLPPDRLASELVDLTASLAGYDRVTVGIPGMVRHGRILATPHYTTVAGPFTAKDPDLLERWAGFDAATALSAAFGKPTLVLNDAELHGYGVITGTGLELVITLGTGLGSAIFDDGRLAPHLELSHHPFRSDQTYDQQVGSAALKSIGPERWNRRVRDAVETFRVVVCFDRLYVGGGSAKHVNLDLGPGVTLIPGTAGLTGGVRAWEGERERP
jgi:polyphosphate glucokinase